MLTATDTLVLATTTRREFGPFRQVIQHDTLRLARAELIGVEEQEFSGGRSVALGVTLAAGITRAILAAVAFGGGGDEPPDDGGGDTPAQLSVLGSLITLVGVLVGN